MCQPITDTLVTLGENPRRDICVDICRPNISHFLMILIYANNLRRLHFCGDSAFHEHNILFAAFMLIAYCSYTFSFMHSSATLIESAYNLMESIK